MSDDFWQRGFAVAERLIEPAQLEFTRRAMEVSERTGLMQMGNRIVPQGAMNEYAPIGGEILLKQCLPRVEAAVGRALLPAYAYWRIYRHGAELRRHKDRNACEVSVSLPVHGEPNDLGWPLHVRDLAGLETGVALLPGAGLIYQGCEIEHWREPFNGEMQYQVFLHYVLKDGPRAHHAFDQRDQLSIERLLG